MTEKRIPIRAMALAGLLAIALGLAACGDSDEGGAGNSNASADTGGDERAVRSALVKAENALYAGNGKAFCAAVTKEVVNDTKRFADKKKNASCENGVSRLIPRPLSPVDVAKYRAKILRVKVTGSKAVVVSRGSDGGIDRMPFVREGGGWKMGMALKKGAPQAQ